MLSLMLATTLALAAAPESRIVIEGDSSVHRWSCETKRFTADVDADAEADLVTAVRRIDAEVPVAGITCGNATMEEKLREALKAEANPVVRYRFTKAEALPDDGAGRRFRVEGELEIAGKMRPITAEVRVEGQGANLRATASVPLLMSDFGVAPPTAMFGALKTRDAIVVKLEVRLGARGLAVVR